MSPLDELIVALLRTASYLRSTTNHFDLVWAHHIEEDARAMRLLSEAGRHREAKREEAAV